MIEAEVLRLTEVDGDSSRLTEVEASEDKGSWGAFTWECGRKLQEDY